MVLRVKNGGTVCLFIHSKKKKCATPSILCAEKSSSLNTQTPTTIMMSPFSGDATVCICHPSVMIEHKTNQNPWDDKELQLRMLFTSQSLWQNRCMECGEDMGEHNPRELCGKTACYNEYTPPTIYDEAAILLARRKHITERHARLVEMSFRPDRVSGMDQQPPSTLFLNKYQGENVFTAVDVDLCMLVAWVMFRNSCPSEILDLVLLLLSEEWFPTFKSFYAWSDDYSVNRGNVTFLGDPRFLSTATSCITVGRSGNLQLPIGKWQHQVCLKQCTTVAITSPKFNRQPDYSLGSQEEDDTSDKFAMLHLKLCPIDEQTWVATRGSVYERRDALPCALPITLFLDDFSRQLHYYPSEYHWCVSRFYTREKKENNKMVRVIRRVPVAVQHLVLSFLKYPHTWVVSFEKPEYWTSAPESELVHYGKTHFLENYCTV